MNTEQNTNAAAVSFTDELRQLSLEQLRDKESFLIDEILRHYDELAHNNICSDYLPVSSGQTLERAISRDNFKLQAIRNEIDFQMKETLLKSCNGIFENLFADGNGDDKAILSLMCGDNQHILCMAKDCRCHCHIK